MKIFDTISQVDVPVLQDGQVYLYVLENYPQGNIKIGRSSNLQQRLKSLSGSNSGGNQIIKVAVSDATWIYILESMVHNHFMEYRIDGTEWFDGSGMTFDDAVSFFDSLFVRPDYARCNEVREHAYRMGIMTNQSVVRGRKESMES